MFILRRGGEGETVDTLQVRLITDCGRGAGGGSGDEGGNDCNDNATTAKMMAMAKMRMMVVQGATMTVMRGGEQGR